MIRLHHKLTRCVEGPDSLPEAFRRADLVDLSLGTIRFGLPRSFVRGVRDAFPNAGFHASLARAWPQAGGRAIRAARCRW